jgi:hypothetical protein
MKQILCGLLLIGLLGSMAFGVTRYIDPDATGTPVDGTIEGQAYRSMDQFEAHEQAVLSAPMIVNLRASSGTPDPNGCGISGWTTSAANYIRLIGDGTYKMQVANSLAVLTVAEDFVRLEGLWIESTAVNTTTNVLRFNYQNAANDVRVDSCVIKGPGMDTDIVRGVRIEDDDGDDTILRMSNSLIYNVGTGTGDVAVSCAEYDTLYLYNCTIIDGNDGILDGLNQEVAGSIIMKNCVFNNNDWSCHIHDAVTTFSEYNLFEDARGFGANKTDSTSLTFIGTTYHLDSTDTEAIGVGVTLTSDPNIAVTYDYDGDSRPQGVGFDLGYDEYVTPGGGAATKPTTIFRRRRM